VAAPRMLRFRKEGPERAWQCERTRDAIAQFLVPQEDWRATAFSLDGHPHLRLVKVSALPVSAFNSLLPCAGGER